MTNCVWSCTKPIIVTSAGIISELEQFPASSGARNSTALAFQYVMASLARIEARLDASERRSALAQPPPRPEPKPPYEDWQRGRGETTRLRPIIYPATTVASQQNLGFVDPSFNIANQPLGTKQLPWDMYGGGSDGFRGRRHTAWDNPTHRLADQPGRLATEWEPPRPDPDPPYSDWQRGRDDTTRHRAVLTTATGVSALPHLGFGGGNSMCGPLHANLSGVSLWDREVLSGVGNRSRQPTTWDNPGHSSEHRSGRPMSTCDNAWGRLEGGGYSATPRLDQVRFEQPRYDTPHLDQLRFEQLCYEKMKAPRLDGSDATNVNFAATTRTDEAGGFVAAGGFKWVSPDSVLSDGSRLPNDASHLLGSSDVEGVDKGRSVALTCDSKCLPNEKTESIANAGLKAGDAMPVLDANLTGIHEVECVKQEATSMYFLSCFQKTSPLEEVVVKWSYKAEWRHSTIPLCAKQQFGAFDPGGRPR